MTAEKKRRLKTRPKGQATFVDAIVLGVFISILLAFTFAASGQPLASQISREEAFYANTMLHSAMTWRNETYGSFSNANLGMSLAEAISLYFCPVQNYSISRADLESSINYILNKTVKPRMNYIFYAEDISSGKQLWVWNAQKDVCAKAMTIAAFGLNLTCPANVTMPMLGIWPEWKHLPPKSACY